MEFEHGPHGDVVLPDVPAHVLRGFDFASTVNRSRPIPKRPCKPKDLPPV